MVKRSAYDLGRDRSNFQQGGHFARAPYNRGLEVITMFRTGNPALKDSTFRGLARAAGEEAMTLQGTVNKTGISLLILIAAAAFVWNSSVPAPFILLGLIGGLI